MQAQRAIVVPSALFLDVRQHMTMESASIVPTKDLIALRAKRDRLQTAIGRNRSQQWCLRLWASFIKARDGYRCVNCGAATTIHAHHVVRQTLYPWGRYELGNGITLCDDCHRKVHEQFNGRPDLLQPLGALGGDDQDEWAYLYGLLSDDAVDRVIDRDEFYYLGDFMLKFFMKCQGYEHLYELVAQGKLTRIRFAHEIWRSMPEEFYKNVIPQMLAPNHFSING